MIKIILIVGASLTISLIAFGFGVWANLVDAEFKLAVAKAGTAAIENKEAISASPSRTSYSSNSADKLEEDANNCGKESALLAALAIKAGKSSSELINHNVIQFEYDRAKELGYYGAEQERFVKISDALFRSLMGQTYEALKRDLAK